MSAADVLDAPAVSPKQRADRAPAEVVTTTSSGWHIMRSLRTGKQPGWRQMLAANAALPPRLKYALSPADGSMELRAECLTSELSLADSCLNYLRGNGFNSGQESGTDADQVSKDEWVHLCEAAGWKAELRPNHTVVVPLSTGRHIRIESSGAAMRAVVELGEMTRDESVVSRARELLLLTLSHEVRMVRPLLRGKAAGTHTLVEIEAGFSRKPEADELNHALSALAVAAEACADVFDALGDEDLASRYLAIRQPGDRPPA